MLNPRSPLLMIGVLAALLVSCKEARLQFTGGSSGHSFLVGRQFVVLKNGFLRGEVTWVAVRNWPESSRPEERLADKRVTLGPHGCCLIRRADGPAAPPDLDPRLYFFDGDNLTTIRIRMKEDDFIGFRPDSFKSYGEVLEYFRRFEVKS